MCGRWVVQLLLLAFLQERDPDCPVGNISTCDSEVYKIQRSRKYTGGRQYYRIKQGSFNMVLFSYRALDQEEKLILMLGIKL